jgi:hypothetical protein
MDNFTKLLQSGNIRAHGVCPVMSAERLPVQYSGAAGAKSG